MVGSAISWYDPLYVDPMILEKADQFRKAIEEGKPLLHVYCVAFASNAANLFDIMSVNELQFPYYKRKKLLILGLAGSRKGAVSLAVQLIEEIYGKTGAFSVRDYFRFK